jgi:DNA (cytosine-5)-methyltransferase 1
MGGLQVIGELAEIGYDAEWRVVSAAGVGAPHRRERIIIVAYTSELLGNGGNNNPKVSMGSKTLSEFGNSSRSARMAYAYNGELGDINKCGINEGSHVERRKVFVTNSPGSSNGRTDSNWILEPSVGRVADGIPDRVDRLRGLGNAVVPQVAEYIGRLVMAAELNNS